MGEGRARSFRWLFEMEPASFEEPLEEEAPPPKPRASRKKVQLVPLEGDEPAPAPAPKKRARKKLTEEDSEPAQIAFNSTKGDVSFSARKRAAKQVEVAEPPSEAPPSPAPLQRQPRATQAKAPPTPGLYEMLHEHLSSRGAERPQRWSQFLVAYVKRNDGRPKAASRPTADENGQDQERVLGELQASPGN